MIELIEYFIKFQTNQQACTTVEENAAFEVSGKEDIGEISNLTAEIQTFVRTHDNDQEKLRESHEKSPPKKKDKSPPIPPVRLTSHTTVVSKGESEKSKVDELPCSQETVTVVAIEQVPLKTIENDVHSHPVEQNEHIDTKVSENGKIISNGTLPKAEPRKLLANSRESPENNEDYPDTRPSQTPDLDNTITIRKASSEKKLNVNDNAEVERHIDVVVQSPPRIIIRKPTEDWENDEEIPLNNNVNNVDIEESPKTPISSEVEFILEHNRSPNTSANTQKLDSEVNTVEAVLNGTSTSLKDDSNEKPVISTRKNYENSLEAFSDVSRETHEIEQLPLEDVPELKIVESTDDLTNTPTISETSDRYKIRFVALKNFSPEPELRSHNKQEFDVEDIDLPPAPPQRRRSVKDIIASINKSQSLLKINQKPNGNTETRKTYNYETFSTQTTPTTIGSDLIKEPSQPQSIACNDSIIQKYNELDESERKIRKMIIDMEKSSIDVPVPVVERFDEFIADNNNSNDLFKKCVVRRNKNSQSGASQDENRSSMEWNPVPKPRRSRNLSHEIESGKI